MAAADPTAPLAQRRWWGWWRPIPRDGGEYMERRSLRRQLATGLNAWRAYVNTFLAPDEPGHHDHPWTWSFSIVLWGSYTEEISYPSMHEPLDHAATYTAPGGFVCTPFGRRVHKRRVRWFNWIPAGKYHRVAELHPSRWGGRGVVTLFVCGPLHGRGWGWWVAGRGHVDQAQYRAEKQANK